MCVTILLYSLPNKLVSLPRTSPDDRLLWAIPSLRFPFHFASFARWSPADTNAMPTIPWLAIQNACYPEATELLLPQVSQTPSKIRPVYRMVAVRTTGSVCRDPENVGRRYVWCLHQKVRIRRASHLENEADTICPIGKDCGHCTWAGCQYSRPFRGRSCATSCRCRTRLKSRPWYVSVKNYLYDTQSIR